MSAEIPPSSSAKNTAIKLSREEAGYGRTKAVWVGVDDCDACGQACVRVLACDPSEGEYGPVRLCRACIVTAMGLEQ